MYGILGGKNQEALGRMAENMAVYPFKLSKVLFDTVGDTRQNHWTIKYRYQWSLKTRGHLQCKTEKYPKHDLIYLYLLDIARDIRQNHWTMQYRSRSGVVRH